MVEQEHRGLKLMALQAARRLPWLALPGGLYVALFLLAPLMLMLRYSFNRFVPSQLMVEAVTLENYGKFFTDSYYQGVLWTTLWTSALSTGICLLLGYPVAYYIARTGAPRLKSLLIIAIVVPLLMGNAVRSAAWMVVLGERGMLSSLVAATGLADRFGLMYTPAGVVIGLVSVLLPFMIITLQSVLEGISTSLEEAAASLGADARRCFLQVVLPLSLPGVLAGTSLCFILAMNAYATPVLIGGPQFHMMAPTVYQQVAEAMNWPFGAALAFVLMTVTLGLSIGANLLVQRRYRRWAE